MIISIRKVPPVSEIKNNPIMCPHSPRGLKVNIQSLGNEKLSTHDSWVLNCSPVSIDMHPAPPPNPYPFGPYFRPWQFLQYNSASCSAQLVESKNFWHIPKMWTFEVILHSLCFGDLKILKLKLQQFFFFQNSRKISSNFEKSLFFHYTPISILSSTYRT